MTNTSLLRYTLFGIPMVPRPELRLNLRENIDEYAEYEQFARDTGLRDDALRAAWHARPKTTVQFPPLHVPRESAHAYCHRIHDEINEMRDRRGVDPLPPLGWGEDDSRVRSDNPADSTIAHPEFQPGKVLGKVKFLTREAYARIPNPPGWIPINNNDYSNDPDDWD